MKFTVYQSSRQGSRQYNQDRLAYAYSKDALLLVLADGMGGHYHGEVAAQLAVKTLTDAFQRLATPSLSSPAKFLIEHIQQVHDMIENVTQAKAHVESPRTTIVAAIIQRNHLWCAHVGDSRLYHFRNGHLLFRTEDHSVVQSLYKRGLITKDAMATHPDKNKVYNCVGGATPPQIDLSNRHELLAGDTVLLCSDGVWGVLDDQKIKEIIQRSADITAATTDLIDSADYAGGTHSDNMSALGLQWGDRLTGQVAISTQLMPLGETTTMMNPVTHQGMDGSHPMHLSDDDIENTIVAIKRALNKTQ